MFVVSLVQQNASIGDQQNASIEEGLNRISAADQAKGNAGLLQDFFPTTLLPSAANHSRNHGQLSLHCFASIALTSDWSFQFIWQ